MKQNGYDAYVIGPLADLTYLTGMRPLTDERFKALFLLADNRYFYISPELYYEETRAALGESADFFSWSDSEGFLKAIRQAAGRYPIKNARIAVNSEVSAADMLNMRELLSAEFFDGRAIMETVRVVKTQEELEFLRQAARIADTVAAEIVDFIHPGVTERAIKEKITALLSEHGGEGNSFEPIVAAGPNSSMPHYLKGSRAFTTGDTVVLDFGCLYKDYCSDISRTVFVGEVSDEQKKVYEIVYEANLAGEKAVVSGAKAGEVDLAAREVIRRYGYGEYFINRTGHGIGVGEHEAPFIKEGNKQLLEDGMVFSVEPGIYLPGRFGLRIEDIVVVNGSRCEILNKADKSLRVVK